MATPFLRLVGRRVLAQTSLIGVERRHYADADGHSHERIIVKHPGAAAVVPVDGEEIVLIRQFRTPVERSLLEIPAGVLDVAGESPEATARRECAEEVGLLPGKLTWLRSMLSTPGFSDERIELFMAEDLTPVPVRPDGIEEHHTEIVRLRLAEVRAALDCGHVLDAKSIIALQDVLARLDVADGHP